MILFLSLETGAQVHNVPSDYATIAEAIEAALPGDTILIAPGTFAEQLVINKDLTLIGAGINNTILRESSSIPDSTILFIDGANVTLKHMQRAWLA